MRTIALAVALVLGLGMSGCAKKTDPGAEKSVGQTAGDAVKGAGDAVGDAAEATVDAVGEAAKTTGEYLTEP